MRALNFAMELQSLRIIIICVVLSLAAVGLLVTAIVYDLLF